MNKKSLFLKLLAIVVGGVAVFLLSSCFTSLRILSCKKSCVESCNSCSANEDDISGHEYGVYYTLNNSGDYYMVSEVGYKETDVVIPETYEGYPVMGIKYRAFEHYKHMGVCAGGYYFGMHLSSLTLPKTIRFIEHGVFASGMDYDYHSESATCDELIFEGTLEDWCDINFESFPLYGGTKLYIDGELLTDLVIPESVTKIKENSFAFYNHFESVTLHENITEIGIAAFRESNVKTLTFPCKDLTVLQSAFFRCEQLEEVNFTGENLTLANDSIFADCAALKEVEWNTVNIQHIPEYAFAYCISLESFAVPASIETIGDNAFEGCYNLIEVINLSKLEIIEGAATHGGVAYYAGAVYNSEGEESRILTEGDYKFVVSEEKTTLFKYTGADEVIFLPELEGVEAYDIRANTFANNNLITTVVIPECVTEIGANAFYSCENLQLVTGCAGVKTVGVGAFNGCEKLVSIELKIVESIGLHAFANCSALKSIKLPATLTSVGGSAFYGCGAQITYDGTLEDWAKVTLSPVAYVDVTVICTDGEWVGKI